MTGVFLGMVNGDATFFAIALIALIRESFGHLYNG